MRPGCQPKSKNRSPPAGSEHKCAAGGHCHPVRPGTAHLRPYSDAGSERKGATAPHGYICVCTLPPGRDANVLLWPCHCRGPLPPGTGPARHICVCTPIPHQDANVTGVGGTGHPGTLVSVLRRRVRTQMCCCGHCHPRAHGLHLRLYSDTTSRRKCYRSGWHRPPRYTCVCTPIPHQDANAEGGAIAPPHGVICRPAGSGSIREFPRTTRLRVRVT